jgi:hypothetical protein
MTHTAENRTVFGPEVLRSLGAAFEEAWDLIPDHFRKPDLLREMLATQIVELALSGEHRPDQLVQGALARLFRGVMRMKSPASAPATKLERR